MDWQRPDSREEEAKRAIAATAIPRPVARAVAAGLLAMVLGMALAETVRGLRAGGPTPWGDLGRATAEAAARAVEGELRTANRVLLTGIEAFEDRLDEESLVADATLPGTQWLLTAVLGTGNEQVLVGRDGWLFFRPGVDALVGPGFLEPRRLAARSAGGDAWQEAPRPDPRPALLAFQRDLAARGIALVVVPAPSKATVHPDRLAPGAETPPEGLQNPSYAQLLRELEAAGVRIFDPAPLLTRARPPDGGGWYLKTDSHWTPAAVDRVAQALAIYLNEEGLVAAPAERAFRRRPAEVVGTGDLRALLRLPAGSRLFPPERVVVERVTTPDGRPWEPAPGAEVLLLGDSFTNVFSQPGLGWGEGAGLAEQLSFHLGRPVDRIARNAGGAHASREALARALARGEDRLAGTRVVVYELAARELAIGDWRMIDLSTAGGTPAVPGGTLDPARMAEGFAVWESNRTGDWRLWTSRLDGSDLRQLTADEPGRQHCCAHLSPDGRSVVYLSRAGAKEAYPEVEIAGDLRLLAMDGSAERTLARARTYGWGNRAAVWRSERELVYVGEDGRTFLLELGTGRSRPLTREPRAELGWLLDPTLAFATNAAPSFSLYDAAGSRVLERQPLAGCEPYFTPDGRWGFWIAGAGGPLQRMSLADRETSTLIRRDDPRLPEGRRYLYFPMVSRDGRFLAWGASDGDHHHFRADYDVFVAPLDPLKVELAGEPIRITEHPATDRYPDVHPPPLALGWQAGEAPLTVRFRTPGPDVRWDWGDGAIERGGPGVHVYEEPGAYAVEARVGGRVLHGEVLVAEAAPPRAVGAALTEDGSRVVVRFDEEVELDDASVRFASGLGIRSRRPGEDGRSLLIEPDGKVEAGEAIELDGVSDRADPPNRMPATRLAVEAPPWPSERGGLSFLWQTATHPNLVYDPEEGALVAEGVEARGPARLDRHGAMVLGRGSFEASERAAARLFEALRASRAVSIEALVTSAAPTDAATPGFIPILALGDGPAGRNLALGQQGRDLALSLLTGPEGASAGPVTVPLFPLPTGRAAHVVVTYSRGELRAYRDGEPVPVPQPIGGGFTRWRPGRLTFGAEGGRGPSWAGTLEGIALYDRVLPPAEVAENAERSHHARSLRPEPPGQLEVRARLRACSRTPTLREITPYRQALAVCEWDVERELAGRAPGRRLRVAHWVLLDGERQPITTLRPGAPARLRLEPFAANPQLEGVVLSDTLAGDPGTVLLYAVEMEGTE